MQQSLKTAIAVWGSCGDNQPGSCTSGRFSPLCGPSNQAYRWQYYGPRFNNKVLPVVCLHVIVLSFIKDKRFPCSVPYSQIWAH